MWFYLKLGWFTTDNAGNNDTMLRSFEQALSMENIAFDADKQRIRSVWLILIPNVLLA